MRNFIKKRWYFVLAAVCVAGLATGFLFKGAVLKDVQASGTQSAYDLKDGLSEGEWAPSGVFSEKAYNVSYYDGCYEVEIKNDALNGEPDVKLYTKDDVDELNKTILGENCRLSVVDSDHASSSDYFSIQYKEYENGYPTGASAGYVFGEGGKIICAFYRKGEAYGFNGQMLSYEEAEVIALKSIADKFNVEDYGFEIELDKRDTEYPHDIYYCPQAKAISYSINEITGHVKGDTTLDGMEVTCFVIISVDGSYVEVASTLGF